MNPIIAEHLEHQGPGWGAWKDPATGVVHDTATVITVDPNELIAGLPHHRMPAILSPEKWSAWLDPNAPIPDLQNILIPCAPELIHVQNGGPMEFRVV